MQERLLHVMREEQEERLSRTRQTRSLRLFAKNYSSQERPLLAGIVLLLKCRNEGKQASRVDTMNQPTSSPIVPIVSALIASGSFAFAIFTYFRTRKFAELRYEITELSDFKIPAAFVQQLGYAPIAVRIESTGNKAAENVFLDLTTTNQIEKYEIEPETFVPAKKPRGNGVQLSIEKLNPAQTLRIFIICSGNPIEKQLGELLLTHSEGKAIQSAREAGLTSTISDLNRRLSDLKDLASAFSFFGGLCVIAIFILYQLLTHRFFDVFQPLYRLFH